MAVFPDGDTVHFGARGYSDFTRHGDTARRRRYIMRHEAREDWTEHGIKTAGFWSRWLLWNKPTLSESLTDINRKFGIMAYMGDDELLQMFRRASNL
jgi:hypothetical protein